jgi:hypothetical protein
LMRLSNWVIVECLAARGGFLAAVGEVETKGPWRKPLVRADLGLAASGNNYALQCPCW